MKNLLIESWAKRYDQSVEDVLSEATEEDSFGKGPEWKEDDNTWPPGNDPEKIDRNYYFNTPQEEKDRRVIDSFKNELRDYQFKLKSTKWAIILLFLNSEWNILEEDNEKTDKLIIEILKKWGAYLKKPYDALGLWRNSWKSQEELDKEWDKTNSEENWRKEGVTPDGQKTGWVSQAEVDMDFDAIDAESDTHPEDDFFLLIKYWIIFLENLKRTCRNYDYTKRNKFAVPYPTV